MDAQAFYQQGWTRLPLDRGDVEFEPYVSNVLEEYRKGVQGLKPADKVIGEIQGQLPLITDTINAINESISLFLIGKPASAFARFSQMLPPLRPFLDRLYTDQLAKYMEHMYRMRTSDSPINKRGELFHIPFQLRQRVGNQRYSVSGVPCLYLGGTSFVCWEELGRPNFDKVYVSHFRLKRGEKPRILDFGFRPSHIAALFDPRIVAGGGGWILDMAAAYGVCWPLIAACSVKTRHREAPFRPEYIVPQMVLEWVTESADHHGLRYSSVNVGLDATNSLALSNFVFPVKNYGTSGFCTEIQGKFELTQPIAWNVAETVDIPGGTVNGNFEVEIFNGFPTWYLDTKFFRMECKLSQLPHDKPN